MIIFVASYLLNLVQTSTIRHACHASGISMNPAAFKIVEKFYFEDLSTDSFRFEAAECENNWLLSYFISDGGVGALQTLDGARGQGHSGVTWPVTSS